jgi:hypothetical protein
MLDFTSLLEFSRIHCVAICAVLVPLNLLTTLQTVVLVGFNRSTARVWQAAGLAGLCALLMVLHVMTWFLVGVVRLETFVLLSLGTVCLSMNLWAALSPQGVRWLLTSLGRFLKAFQTRVAS